MKDIRKQIGISQEQLASYLGVPRSQVASAEANTRDYSTAALIKVSKMFAALQQQTEPVQLANDRATQITAFIKTLQHRKNECVYQLAVAQRKLNALQTQYSQCSNALKIVNELRTQLPEDEQRDKQWLDILEHENITKLKTCGMESQTMLQFQIEVLGFELGKLEGMMK